MIRCVIALIACRTSVSSGSCLHAVSAMGNATLATSTNPLIRVLRGRDRDGVVGIRRFGQLHSLPAESNLPPLLSSAATRAARSR